MDVKKVGRSPTAVGGRPTAARSARPAFRSKARIGFDYVHSVVDDHSRLAYSEVLPDEQGPTCAAFLLRAGAYFAGHGIARIERVMTDNHWSYSRSTDVAQPMTALGATHVFIRPHCPWQNGKVERFNRTLQVEWAYRQVFLTNADRSRRTGTLAGRSTTLDDATQPSEDNPRSADCHEPVSRVHLAQGCRVPARPRRRPQP